MSGDENIAHAWGLPGVLEFFENARTTTAQVYASEWFFLKDRMRQGMSVLDVGCAQGGFASVLAEHLEQFHYTGLDVSAEMVERARNKHPEHTFHHVPDGEWSVLGHDCFDLVLVLGILHLHLGWRDTIAKAWARTRHCLLLDLREIEGATIEDPARSCFRMDFGGGDARHGETTIPYILVNSAEALATIRRLCPDAARITHYGYLHPLSSSARAPVDKAMANVWCIER